MDVLATVAIDLLAVSLLTFALYFPRHRRRDLVVAFLGVNVGVLAVTLSLSATTVGAGLGLGLFGVLSIIRLRSSEIAQHEVAYYFAALAIGLVSGLGSPSLLTGGLIALILLVMVIGDHPGLFRSYRQQVIVLDRAEPDEQLLRERLEQLLGARVHGITVQRLDLVDDTTTIEVRYAVEPARTGASSAERLPAAEVRA